jgi:hypothetical protein
MAVRIYEISKKLGLENKEILAAAKALGITAAKIPSSSLDKITAEYLEEELLKTHPDVAARLIPGDPVEPKPAPIEQKIESSKRSSQSASSSNLEGPLPNQRSIPRASKREAIKLNPDGDLISPKIPLIGIPEATADCIVAIHGNDNQQIPSGVGCAVGQNRILTTGQAIGLTIPFDSTSLMEREILISLPWLAHRQKIRSRIVKVEGGANLYEFLILLEIVAPPVKFHFAPKFASILNYPGKDYIIAGFSQNDPQGITASGQIGRADNDGKYELAKPDEKGLSGFSGSPVWSPEMSAFIGLVTGGNPGRFMPASRLCRFATELGVYFQIPESDRPKKVDPSVDYNANFFPGTRAEENGRKLTAQLEQLPNRTYRLTMMYEILDDAQLTRGKYVTFVTYPNMGKNYQITEAIAGNRKVSVVCELLIPDFTIAAIGDGGDTRLTLNLKNLPRTKTGSQKPLSSAELEELENTPDVLFDPKTKAPPTGESPISLYRYTYAAFGNDLVAFDAKAFKEPLTDALGNAVYARHLAQLIIARQTPLPLSLGLFGDWGAGKSYFMRLLHQEIDSISARKDHDVFCRKVVQIHFNAWHYLDTNLWANLVCEIFDNLFQSLTDREGASKAKVEQLKKKLAEESALAAEAKKALEDAKRARENAEAKLKQAAKEREEQENSVALFLDDLKQVAADAGLQTKLKELAHGFGLTRLSESYKELEKSAEDARSLAGRFRSLGLTLLSPEGRWQRLGLLSAALVIPVMLALAVPWILGMKDDLAGFTRSVTAAVSLLGTIAAWISAQTKRGTELLNKLETTYTSVKQARENVRKQKQPAAEQAKLDERIKQEIEAQHALHEAEAKVRAIESELRELAPGRRLLKFLEQRTGANDYRQHLGMVSLVRRDFKQLSDLLQEGNEFKEDGQPMLDRIVLYIDDLDRCKSARVIEVLEAVHLLLAFPLFAVVVAVDPRWLRKSLVEHYPTLLAGGGPAAGTLRAKIGRVWPVLRIFWKRFSKCRSSWSGLKRMVSPSW